MAVLDINNLTKTYGGKTTAVSGLSLSIERGDIYGFIGHNGAGKTTTIKCVVGILPFEEGEITIDGHSIKKEPLLVKSLLAYIPDNPDLYEYLTGIQYLNFVADVFKIPSDVRTKRIERYSTTFDLVGPLGDPVSSYSHGMKQKLAIISALITQPKLLLLDEPFVGLDPEASLTLKNAMKDYANEGNAIFFSTHVLEQAEKLCNKIAIINDGKLVASGTLEEVTKGRSLEESFMEAVHA